MRKRAFPRKVKVLGREFKIIQKANLAYMGQAALGLCHFDEKTLFIEKHQTAESKRQTLVHECGHAFLIIAGIDQRLSDSENEIYCQLLTAFCEDMKKVI